MKYIVKVEERIIKKSQKKDAFCHVISSKNATITSYKIVKGQAGVDINDYVKKGDILINGEVKYNDDVKERVCAEGKIYGEVWYSINISLPLNYYEKEYTGKSRNNIVFDIDGKKNKIFKDRLKNFDEESKELVNLLGIKIYLVRQKEYNKIYKQYSDEEAINKAMKLAKEKVKIKLSNDDRIITEKILQKETNDSKMNIEIFIVAEENIGKKEIIEESVDNDSQINKE